MHKNIADSLIILYSELRRVYSRTVKKKKKIYLKQVDFIQDGEKGNSIVTFINLHL